MSTVLSTALVLENKGFLAYPDYWARHRENAPAIHCDTGTLTYRQVSERAARLADGLARRGVGAGSTVGVALARGESLVPLLLAVWSLRAAYVPVDPAYPIERQNDILNNAGVSLLVVDGPQAGRDFAGECITPEALLSDVSPSPLRALAAPEYRPDDLAYILYTSGSTGHPKGVAVTQSNLIHFLLAMVEAPQLTSADRLLAITTIAFDIHILECFLPLLVGAQLVLATRDDAVDATRLQTLVDTWQITAMQATPAGWRMLLDRGWLPAQPLKILVGGEALPPDLLPRLHRASSELWNLYGPTETTVWSTCHRLLPEDSRICIGRPIRGTRVCVVGDRLQPLPDGVTGELLIGGEGVARGYYRNPALTAERFLEIPALGPGRWYRTGDAVVRHPDGVLEYINRLDNQIKMRGFRIEPAEIERVLQACEGVRQAVVVAAEFPGAERRLVAFCLGETAVDLLQHCREHLPAYMVPQHVVPVDAWPLTANGKLDRKALVAMAPLRVGLPDRADDNDARDDLDRSLIAVWERVLHCRGVGLDHDFFELGGDSLSALRALADMQRSTGLVFSSTAMFATPTLRGLRASLGDAVEQAASVVPLNGAAQNRTLPGEPLFCLCGVQVYRELAQCFEGQHPVFGVFAQQEFAILQMPEGQRMRHDSLEVLAQAYVDAIVRQGDCPRLMLAGLSFGGQVALEVAQALRARGVEVTGTVLLDTYLPNSSYRSLGQMLQDLLHRVRGQGLRDLFRAFGKAGRVPRRLHRKMREKAFDRAGAGYENPRRTYDGDALLIRAERTQFGFGKRVKPDYGLRSRVRGELRVTSVAADHLGMMVGDAVVQVYHAMQEYAHRRRDRGRTSHNDRASP